QTVTNVVTIDLPAGHVDEDSSSIPLVGRIAAGAPITAEQYVEDVFELPTRLTGHGQMFMLEVSGESMVDAGILDG
ncbi:LexA family protein, partial [Actinomyces urogenitalis]